MSIIPRSNSHEDLSSQSERTCLCPGRQVWSHALEDLELQMPRATFDTWLKDTTAEVNGDTLTVTVANIFGQEWLDQRLRPKIENAVASTAGRPLNVVFTINGNGKVTPDLEDDKLLTEPEIEYYEIQASADPMVLRIMPDLAEEIGLNESIVLLQIDYWIRHSDNVRDSRRWTYQSSGDMRQKAFKWWHRTTIWRAVERLKEQALILVTDKHNKHKYDRTPWFALNPEGFKALTSVEFKPIETENPDVKHYEIQAPNNPTVLRIMPDLAEEIGLNESIVLLQLDYWIRHSDNVRDGRRWTFQSVRGMQKKAFRWWGKSTINRTIASLIRQRLIFATDEYNQHEYERTRWFALNPEEFRMLESVELKRA